MKKQNNLLALALTLATSVLAPAQAANIALDKQYAYFDVLPLEAPNYYRDDTHSQSLGVFSTGQLTDGIIQTGDPATQGDIPSPDIAFVSGGVGRVIVDLESVFSLNSLILGTNRYANFANFRPESVYLSFSTIGLASQDFSTPVLWSLPADLSDGHADATYTFGSAVNARYVQVDFNTPNHPSEVHFDELSINSVPTPSAFVMLFLGLMSLGAVKKRQFLTRYVTY
jgi:hypothetical protein